MDPHDFFIRLKAHAETDLLFQLRPPSPNDQLGESGNYSWRRWPQGEPEPKSRFIGVITLIHPDGSQALGHTWDDVMTLAHEMGHAESERQGTATDGYKRAVLRTDRKESLSPEQARLILDEEKRAWVNARRILQSFGFESWTDFDEKVEASLNIYRQKLGLGSSDASDPT